MVKRGELYWLTTDDDHGSVPAIGHPYVVVQDDVFNQSRIRMVVVCGLTSNLKRAQEPGNVLLDEGEGNLERRSVVIVSQLASVDKSKFAEPFGVLSQDRVDQILAGLRFQQAIMHRQE